LWHEPWIEVDQLLEVNVPERGPPTDDLERKVPVQLGRTLWVFRFFLMTGVLNVVLESVLPPSLPKPLRWLEKVLRHSRRVHEPQNSSLHLRRNVLDPSKICSHFSLLILE
jgi:hypothetical protein